MYKIFVNENLLILSEETLKSALNIEFQNYQNFNQAINLLYNSEESIVNIYYIDKDKLWNNFIQHIQQVSAAGGIVQNKDGEYLFIKRRGVWDFPKGHIEKGETKEEAAVREVEEECSITPLKIVEYITATHHIYMNNDEYILKSTYWYSMLYLGNKMPSPQTEEDIELVTWVSKTDIPELMKNTYKNIQLLVELSIFNSIKRS